MTEAKQRFGFGHDAPRLTVLEKGNKVISLVFADNGAASALSPQPKFG